MWQPLRHVSNPGSTKGSDICVLLSQLCGADFCFLVRSASTTAALILQRHHFPYLHSGCCPIHFLSAVERSSLMRQRAAFSPTTGCLSDSTVFCQVSANLGRDTQVISVTIQPQFSLRVTAGEKELGEIRIWRRWMLNRIGSNCSIQLRASENLCLCLVWLCLKRMQQKPLDDKWNIKIRAHIFLVRFASCTVLLLLM